MKLHCGRYNTREAAEDYAEHIGGTVHATMVFDVFIEGDINGCENSET